MNKALSSLRITEIFYSLQGESTYVGLPTVFIRLTGCPLRCDYCDTAYAFTGGKKISLENIMDQVKTYSCKTVCITGGEPLSQPGVHTLMKHLCDEGYRVSIETSGALSIKAIDQRIMIVMDLKTPASKESSKNDLSNLAYLKPSDQIKFVLCNRDDYEWACTMITTYRLTDQCEVLFSPSYETLNPTTLAQWILQDNLCVRFQLQLHKILWNDAQGH
ncbi:MAG: 7-carboxy-7-deazaguanine synthase QueE [Legionellaceae bacterium]